MRLINLVRLTVLLHVERQRNVILLLSKVPVKKCKKILKKVYSSLCPQYCSHVFFQDNDASINAAIVNSAKFKDALLPELSVELLVEFSVGTTASSVFTNLNSPKLWMGLGPLNAPAMSFVISKMLTCGSVASLEVENAVPSSVPASHGGDMVMFILSRHVPLLHMSRLSIPINQSGEGANIVIMDTLEKFAVT